MSKRIVRSWRTVVIVIVAVGLLTQPAANAYAMESTAPPVPTTAPADPVERLERAWQREQHLRDRMALAFDRIDQRLSRLQELIDRAESSGKDVNALQTALNALADAVKRARPIFESTQGILASHPGFDADGHVTDLVRALQTVRELGDKLRAVRDEVIEPARALREAIRSFREANHPVP